MIMTNQEAFDKMIVHLKNQGWEQSLVNNNGDCAYRSSDGKMCAVGVLIPDEEYKTYWDMVIAPIGRIYHLCPSLSGIDIFLLRRMQEFHDSHMHITSDRYNKLQEIATEFNLEFNYDGEFFE